MHNSGSPGAESWHEAGHAVVAHILGGRVRGLTLETAEDAFDGQVSIEWSAMAVAAHAEVSACSALGGPLAELAFADTGAVPTSAVLSTWRADWREVQRCAARVCDSDADREVWTRRCIHATRTILDDPEVLERVARVADALDAHGTLDEDLFVGAFA